MYLHPPIYCINAGNIKLEEQPMSQGHIDVIYTGFIIIKIPHISWSRHHYCCKIQPQGPFHLVAFYNMHRLVAFYGKHRLIAFYYDKQRLVAFYNDKKRYYKMLFTKSSV